ncbi:MAG: DNA-3-methyladenine glycosylase I [Flavobacteriaceae bacterium]
MEPKRCHWCLGDSLYQRYHDEEWGVPLFNDAKLFEFLLLETFQAGLSWITILKKREAFRTAFDHFDSEKIALYNTSKIEELMTNSAIIRNRLKIEAAVKNAQAFIALKEQNMSFSDYLWSFVGGTPLVHHFSHHKEIPDYIPLAVTLSKELKRKGFSFIGPTVMYAHMQATGMVNDHLVDCFRYKEV